MYQVVGHLASRAFRVFWALEELGVPYENLNEVAHSDRVKALNPSGKIPVLIDGETALTDSAAIMSFLADRHGGLTYPAGTHERARQDAFLHRINDEMDAVLWTATRHAKYLPEDQRVPAVTPSLKWEFERNANRMADDLTGEFLMGDQMTVPDILLAHCLLWAKKAEFPIPRQELLYYLNRMTARDAFKRVMAIGS